MNQEKVLREFTGWWPVELALDKQPIADGADVQLISLPSGSRPTDPSDDGTWHDAHLDDAGNWCVFLEPADDERIEYVYGRPASAPPEDPVFQIDGSFIRY